jgi:imidazolonepropionase-like amidohydrolase
MQPDIALAAADETHRRNRLVLAHPTDIEGVNLAIEAGVDVLVHTTIGEGKTTGMRRSSRRCSRRTWPSCRRCSSFRTS